MNSIMQKKPLVSVIIPVYNGEKFIAECLESVYAQTWHPLEVIIVDDGSTDNSLAIVEQLPGEKRIICQNNLDVSAARNTGVRQSNGDFIAFLDQDDVWLPDKLNKQMDIFKQYPEIDLVFTDLIKFYESGKEHHARDKHKLALKLNHNNLFSTLIRKNLLMPSEVVVKKASFNIAGGFDENFRTCGDYEMWLRMAGLGMKFHYIPEVLLKYRQHGSNAAKNTEIMFQDRINAVTKIFSFPELRPEHRKLERTGLAAAYMMGAHTLFSIKKYRQFMHYARMAYSYDKCVLNTKFVTRYIRSCFFQKAEQ